MNREEFVDIFSQNVHVSGGGRRFFAEVTYIGNELSTLVPANLNARTLAVPLGEGFRILISRNSSLISKKKGQNVPMSVRATRKAFKNISEVASRNGFRLYDIVLSRAGENIVSVSGDANISKELYEKYSGDPASIPVFLGFRSEGCTVTFSTDMKVTCQGYIREAGALIFDSIQGILSDSSIYQEVYQSFNPKRDEMWTAHINPVNIKGSFGDRDQIISKLERRLPEGLDIKAEGKSGIYFSHSSGLWGVISCTSDTLRVYFMAEADFNLGIELMDALRELVQD